MRAWGALAVAALASGCLSAFDAGGPWRCSEGQTCPAGLTCDDGLCCDRDSEKGCPTLPHSRTLRCADGREARLHYEDRDGDGEGNTRVSRFLCRVPVAGGWVTNDRDCDDASAAINAAALETCNGRDDNCNGDIDEGLSRSWWFRDEDGDGFGVDSAPTRVLACVAPPGFVAAAGDCQPFDPSKFPGAPELCNNLDDDCDGQPDAPGGGYADTDFGGTSVYPCLTTRQGVCRAGTFQCVAGGSGVVRQCTSVQAPDLDRCNFLDDDCDGTVDEAPTCGGPPSLRGAGVTRGTRSAASLTVAQQTAGCLRDVTTATSGWNDGTGLWTAAGSGYHLWLAEAPAAAPWDLSKPDLKLRVRLSVVSRAGSPTFGNNALPDGGVQSTYGHPVVYLCGPTASDVVRYVVRGYSTPAQVVRLNDTTTVFDQTFTLNVATGPAYLIGAGSGFDTTRVRRVEVLIYGLAGFSVRVEPETGFVP